MMEKEIILKIEGNEFSGWQSAEVSKGLNQLAGAFAMSYTDKATIPIKMGQECTVEINGHVLITGHVEYIDSRFNGTMHQLQVRGRDKLGDLVDCCFYDKDNLHSGEFKDESVLNIVKRLCEPYDVDVVLDETDSSLVEEHLSTKKINFSVETGETIADCLVRLSKMHAFLPVGYGDGKLTLTRAGTNRFATTPLIVGQNIKEAQLVQSNANRFKYYIVKGMNTGFDWTTLEENSQNGELVEDNLITRYRAIVLIAEDNATQADCAKRADWERKVRAGKSREFGYVVTGWLQEDGTPWPLNSMVKIQDPIHNPNSDSLLCSRVVYSLTQNGRVTKMNFVNKEAFDLVKSPDVIKTQFDLDTLIGGGSS